MPDVGGACALRRHERVPRDFRGTRRCDAPVWPTTISRVGARRPPVECRWPPSFRDARKLAFLRNEKSKFEGGEEEKFSVSKMKSLLISSSISKMNQEEFDEGSIISDKVLFMKTIGIKGKVDVYRKKRV